MIFRECILRRFIVQVLRGSVAFIKFGCSHCAIIKTKLDEFGGRSVRYCS